MGRFQLHNVDIDILLDGDSIQAQDGTIPGLLGLSVSNEVNRVPRARIEMIYSHVIATESESKGYNLVSSERLSSPSSPTKAADFLPGTHVSIVFGKGQERQEVFQGYINRQHFTVSENNRKIVSIECKHVVNRMTLHERTRFFHHEANDKPSNQDSIDPVDELSVLRHLVSEVHSDLKLKLNVEQDISSVSHENMTQYRCSDWDFLILRAEAHGLVCFPDGNELRLFAPEVKATASETLKFGRDILEYEAQYDETLDSSFNAISAWKSDHDKVVTELDDANNGEVQKSKGELIRSDRFYNQTGSLEPSEMKAYLEGNVRRQQLGKIQGLVKVIGTTKVQVGDTIRLDGFQSVWDRETFVSGVRHDFSRGTWKTHIQCGLCEKSHAEKYGLSKSPNSLVPETNGLMYGVVSAYKTDQYGREMVEVEISASNEDDKNASTKEEWQGKSVYARLSTLMASEENGVVFRPYPGDEVVLGFVGNDPRFPVVLGSMYNVKRKPLYDLKDKKTQEEIGFSIKEWNWKINEADGTMEMYSPKGQTISIEESDSTKQISILFDDSNSLTISKEGIKMNAKAITMEATDDVKINGKNIQTTGQQNVEIEGNAKVKVEGKVNTAVKGQTVNIN